MRHPRTARPRRGFGLLLAGLLALLALPTGAAQAFSASVPAPQDSQELLARKGGGGGGSRGGRGGGGGSRPSASRGASGFKSSGSSLNRGSNKPSGGWSSRSNQKGGPSLDARRSSDNRGNNRGFARSDRASNRNGNRDDRNGNRDDRTSSRNDRRDDRSGNRDDRRDDRGQNRDDRRDDRNDNRNERRDDRWDRRDDRWNDRGDRWDRRWDRWDNYPGWARPGWGYARPWNYGWYGGWASPSWGWWGASAAAWGVTTLATAAIINAAVDDAVNSHTTTIVVPNTDYRLLYGSVEPLNEQSVSFSVESGDREVAMNADCRQGTLDGRNPSTAQEAELLNAACQVAFGDV
ncbi:MAG: hypothetical protein FJ054_05270 [Cyanobacteria bacterium M_surface_10_m2_119]|nr:hypothetical protein [Cyanobacteria bacterium M_surface_10_m2_119]